MYNVLSDTKNIEKRNTQVNLIKSGLIDLKKDIEHESKDDVNKIGEMYKIADIAELILKFNDDDDDDKQFDFTDMLELESEEFAAQRINTQGKGLKILIPNEMLSRLPITLAQLKAGNNSEKLKNENKATIVFFVKFKKAYKANL